jgi:hypothetical protein
VHISQSPFDVPGYFLKNAEPWPDRAARAEAAMQLLGAGQQEWGAVAARNSSVPTTLVAFTKERSAELLHHAYVLAAVNLHVVLGFPLPATLSDRQRFEKLVA